MNPAKSHSFISPNLHCGDPLSRTQRVRPHPRCRHHPQRQSADARGFGVGRGGTRAGRVPPPTHDSPIERLCGRCVRTTKAMRRMTTTSWRTMARRGGKTSVKTSAKRKSQTTRTAATMACSTS
eukprot:scaffold56594_cov72-Phaeocystis_antarctica.AAC.1